MQLEGYISNLDELLENPEMYNKPIEPSLRDVTWQYVTPVGIGLSRMGLNPVSRLTGRGLNALNSVARFNNGYKKADLGQYTPEEIYDIFSNPNSPAIEEMPEPYTGERNIKGLIQYLGGEGMEAKTKTPIEEVIWNRNNLPHPLYDNEPERLEFLNNGIRTFENPNMILSEIKNNKDYNIYMKAFKDGEEIKPYFSVARKAPDGTFFSTHRPMGRNNFLNKYNNGQVIYHNLPDQMVITQKTLPTKNIITDLGNKFKSALFKYLMK